MMEWLDHVSKYAFAWATALTVFSLVSLVFILGSVGRMVVRLPADYFNGPAPKRPPCSKGPFGRLLVKLGRNLLGALLLLLGLVLVVPGVPGQGLLTILVGLLFVDFPGKYRLERFLLGWRPLRKLVDRLRIKRGRPPLDPQTPHAASGPT